MKRIIFFLLITLLPFLSESIVMAQSNIEGLGLYMNGGGNRHYIKDLTNKHDDSVIKKNSWYYGGGLVLEAGVRDGSLVHYRTNLGFDIHDIEFTNKYRINWMNTFSFTIVENKSVRFWAGPQFTVYYVWCNHTQLTDKAGGLQAGPALGLDLHVTERMTLALEGGFRYGFSYGKANYRIYNFWPRNDRTQLSHGYEGYGAVSMLFRFGSDNAE